MGTSLVTARPTTTVRPGCRSMACSPVVLSSLNTTAQYTSITGLGEGERLEDRLRLRFSLRELARRIGIGDDPGARLHGHAIRQHHRRADRDRGVEVDRAPAHVAHRTGVRAAALGLELVDDLHRAHLRRPGHGAGGEARLEDVERVEPFAQPAPHLAHQVLHVRIAFDREQVADANAPVPGHTADVVPAQVHEHQVLGALLLIGLEGLRQRVILGRGRAARPCACDGPHGDLAVLHPHQHLRGAAHAGQVVERQIEKVGRRVERPQIPVQAQRIGRAGGVLPARQHRLERVARLDVFEDARHVPLERVARVPGDSGHGRHAVPQRERRQPVRRAEAAHELVEARRRRVVQPVQLAAPGARPHLDVHDDDRAAEQVVEDDEAVRDHHDGVRNAQRIGRPPGEALDGADEIIAQVADGAAREPRQPRHGDRGQGPQPQGEVPDRIVGLARRRPALAPGPALAAHQRFEQERERGSRDLGERRDRGVRVEHDLADHGHHAARPRLLSAAEKLNARVGHLDYARMRHLPLTAGVVLAVMLLAPPGAAAQAWNSVSGLALVRRAIARRALAAGDTALRDYKAQAHGFVFFLGQFGEGLTEPPRLVKADQLELEVYWKAPGLSKQRIVGWRDRAELPTDIAYHRDHLGIIQNNFGSAIRLGDGDEVRDVPHPLAPGALDLYDFALGDTTTIELPRRTVRVVAVQVRPKDFTRAGIVGTVYLDAGSADLVRMAFNFTARAYLDPQLEDVSIVLDNALWEDRFWLPYRQEVEIRRRATWLDVPARGIIRGRWQVDGYAFNLGLAASWFAGDEITAAPQAERDSFPWREPLAAAIQAVAEPVRESDLAAVRAAVERIAGEHVLSGLKARRVGVRSVSGSVAGLARRGRGVLEGTLYRAVRDVGEPVIAPILNSFAAQEFGDDYGDYYQATGARVAYRHGLGARGEWSASAGRETTDSLPVRAQPAAGRFRPNPALAPTGVDRVELALRRRSEGFAVRRDLHAELTLEGGRVDGGATYVRVAGAAHVLFPLGATRGLLRVRGGAASDALPAYRAFVLGGRGTLLGDDFRRWGGRRLALVHAEWRIPAPFLSLALGPYARTPRSIVLAPFVATGWADRPVAATPWSTTPGARTTLGFAVEWLGVFRIEWGVGVQTRQLRFAFDLTRDFWDIL